MSTCISKHGEYSSHNPSATDPLMCGRCFVFDEERAREQLTQVRKILLSDPTFDDLHIADAVRLAQVAISVGLIVHVGAIGEPMRITEGP